MTDHATHSVHDGDAAVFDQCVGAPAVVVAMDAEAAPFIAQSQEHASQPLSLGHALVYATVLDNQPVLLVRTGIGLVNAASAAASVIQRFKPSVMISAGSAGGLQAQVKVGDVIIGTTYRYADVDATVFGYVPGQVPNMPEYYRTPPYLENAARAIDGSTDRTVLHGTMLSGGSFVTEANVGMTRQVFPDALTTDMETTALAQVCASWNYPFIAVRSVSDLCGPAAEQDFHMEINLVAEISAHAVRRLLRAIQDNPPE